MKTAGPYPLLCAPALKSRIWGGRKLESLFGIELPQGRKIGEAWLAADLREGASLVANGPLAGSTLSQAREAWGEDLIGTAWARRPTGRRFPLLVKFLDAQDDLSVQVHPDEEACRRYFPDEFSKDESWVVLDVEAGGRILHGFKPGTTLEDFDRLLAAGEVVGCLRSVAVRPGEVYRVAPGTVHALCRGVVILEIQEPSDTTFRVFDYNRLGEDGRPRPLHIDSARKVMRFGDDTPPRRTPEKRALPWGTHEVLVDAPVYRMERIEARSKLAWPVDPASTQVLVATRGGGELRSGGQSVELRAGSCAILPAAIGEATLRVRGGSLCCVLAGAGGIPMIRP